MKYEAVASLAAGFQLVTLAAAQAGTSVLVPVDNCFASIQNFPTGTGTLA